MVTFSNHNRSVLKKKMAHRHQLKCNYLKSIHPITKLITYSESA